MEEIDKKINLKTAKTAKFAMIGSEEGVPLFTLTVFNVKRTSLHFAIKESRLWIFRQLAAVLRGSGL